MPHPSRPLLAELAYREYCRYLDGPQPAWGDLSIAERLAWTMAVKRAVQEATTPPKGMAKSPHHRWQSVS